MAYLHGFPPQEMPPVFFAPCPNPLPRKNIRRKLGCPIPLSEKDRQQGMKGVWGYLYCPACYGKFDFILIEYKNPSSISSRCEENRMEEWQEDITKCPHCGHEGLLPESW